MALDQSLQFMVFQETRHNGEYAWAARIAEQHGYNWQWSQAPPLNSAGKRRQGGTAIAWRRELGRGTKIDGNDHRATARAVANVVVMSVYGPAQAPDLQWLQKQIDLARHADKQYAILVGDYNWKRIYNGVLSPEVRPGPVVISTKEAKATPTRCLVLSKDAPTTRVMTLALPGSRTTWQWRMT